jgi:2-methylisocitrate lyase-like PEP mutase family enzyme
MAYREAKMGTDGEKRRALKTALAADEIVLAPGCGDVVTARLVEACGVAAIHASGSVAHRTSGYADAGFLSLTEMTERIAALCGGVDIPVIADADTGFGGAANVIRTVKDYERAGAAALHIEDQLTPKRPTHLGYGGSFITRAEMVDKIRAAVDARNDENFLVIARIDVGDWDEKLERIAACMEAGADCGWISAREEDGIREIVRVAGKPCVGVLQANMTLPEYQALGVACAFVPAALQIAALCAQKAVLTALAETGGFADCLDAMPHVAEMRPFYLQQGNAELKRIEAEYSGEEKG